MTVFQMKVNRKRQYIGAFFILLLLIVNGGQIGWTSPALIELLSEETPLLSGPITLGEASWIAAIFCPASVLGTIFFTWLSNKQGRKFSAFLTSFIQILAWMIIVMATHPYFLFASKILSGFSNSGVFVIGPTFIAEISEARIRGFLGSMLILFVNLGMLFAFILGAFLNNCLDMPYFFLPLNLLFMIGFSFFPETPYFFAVKGKYAKAEKSLRFYRSLKEDDATLESITYELGLLKNISFKAAENNCKYKVKMKKILRQKPITKSLIIGVSLCLLQQLSGCFGMMNYTATIFEDAGSSLSPNMSSIIVGVIQLFGSYLSTVLVDRLGRKVLLISSALGCFIGHAVFGAYSYIHDQSEANVEPYKWISLVSFSFTILIANLGVINLPFLILSEILPLEIKGFGITLCYAVLNLASFLIIKFLPIIIDQHGLYIPLFFFSGFSFIGAIFVIFYLPETKGKTFDEITRSLQGSKFQGPF